MKSFGRGSGGGFGFTPLFHSTDHGDSRECLVFFEQQVTFVWNVLFSGK